MKTFFKRVLVQILNFYFSETRVRPNVGSSPICRVEPILAPDTAGESPPREPPLDGSASQVAESGG